MYDEKSISLLKSLLVNKQLTIAVAESVTGGHLQASISAAENAGEFFHGGITAYNIGQKSRHLKINTIGAEKCNCVSKEIAVQMAFGVSDLFSSDVAISTTGYATPLPEEGVKKVFAWFAVVSGKKLLGAFRITSQQKDPVAVQIDYTNTIIAKTVKLLK